ncbi:sperm microtubule inner protein 11-like [Symsagittifera roscoffensis]|uniref:sperm microtubule inner protein 11-like n=1 Tax=Symsagittifera roscoffensis TaxID=84072 RepID=UPI00307BBF9B
MAGFFNLTQLGFQNTVRERCKDVKEDAKVDQGQLSIKYSSGLPAVAITPANEKVKPTLEIHHGSKQTYDKMRSEVSPFDPNDMYKEPQSVAMEHGWKTEQVPLESIQPPNWYKGPHFPSVESEMTKFVKDMKLTDKNFTLY